MSLAANDYSTSASPPPRPRGPLRSASLTTMEVDKQTLSNERFTPNPPSVCVSPTQVEPTASALNTNDVFVLKTPEALYLWKGKGQTGEEMDAARYVASLLGGAVTEVEEGEEPGES